MIKKNPLTSAGSKLAKGQSKILTPLTVRSRKLLAIGGKSSFPVIRQDCSLACKRLSNKWVKQGVSAPVPGASHQAAASQMRSNRGLGDEDFHYQEVSSRNNFRCSSVRKVGILMTTTMADGNTIISSALNISDGTCISRRRIFVSLRVKSASDQ